MSPRPPTQANCTKALSCFSGSLIMCVCTALAVGPAPFEVRAPDFQTYDFGETVPAEFAVDGKVTLAIDRAVFKGQGGSLKWSWAEPGAALTFRHPDAFKRLTGRAPDPIVYEWITFTRLSTFSLWVYNDAPIEDVLWFEIGDGARVDCRFWMSLNFAGWRPLKAMYGRDIEPLGGFPNQDNADTLRILAPKSAVQGTLRFDLFCPRSEQDVRFVRATDEAPWVRPRDRDGAFIDPGQYVKGRHHDGLPNQAPTLELDLPETLSAEQTAVIRRLRSTYLARAAAAPKPREVTEKTVAALRAKHAEHGFVRSPDGTVSGSVGHPGRFWRAANGLTGVWHQAAGQPDVQAELWKLYQDYVDLCIQQGHGAGYGLRTAFVRPVRLMRDELAAHGRWRPLLDRLRAINGIDDLYNTRTQANADVYNTMLAGRLSVVLLESDDRVVHRDLLALRHWLERTARYGEIKPDGSLFHHRQTYSGYNLPAISPWVDALHVLRDTEYFPPTSHLYAYRTVYAMHWYSCITDMPHTLSGRWRNSGRFHWGLAQNCRKLAEIAECRLQIAECRLPDGGRGLPPGDGVPDHGLRCSSVGPSMGLSSRPHSAFCTLHSEFCIQHSAFNQMAAIYLYYARHFGKQDEWTRRFSELGVEPADTNGHLALNYTVAAIHRRDDWMVFFRGQRHPFFSTDMYPFQAGNTIGRYINFGHMAIYSAGEPTSTVGSGWGPPKNALGGFNPNFWPGTTAREIPLDALRSPFSVEEAMTAETFAVGTHLDGNGVFGLKLQEDEVHEIDPRRIGPVKYWLGEAEYQRRIKAAMIDTSFRARKSVFCFDNRIVCLGSGIRADDPDHRVATTLFQHHLSEDRKGGFQVSGVRFPEGGQAAFPLETRLAGAEGSWLIDSIGNGYVLPAGHAPLEIVRKHQKLPYHTHRNDRQPELNQEIDPNEGDTELALLDHGPAPDGASYHYTVLIRTTPDECAELAADLRAAQQAPYAVLHQSDGAHIVHHHASNSTGYVLFEATAPQVSGATPQSAIPPPQSAIHNLQSAICNLQSAILHVSKPCVAMVRRVDAKRIRLSVCDPELGPAPDDAEPLADPHADTTLTVTLAGNWRLGVRNPQVAETATERGRTSLTFRCRHLRPIVVELVTAGQEEAP